MLKTPLGPTPSSSMPLFSCLADRFAIVESVERATHSGVTPGIHCAVVHILLQACGKRTHNSRSARIRAFRAYQHAPSAEKGRIRRGQMEDVIGGATAKVALSSGLGEGGSLGGGGRNGRLCILLAQMKSRVCFVMSWRG